MSRSVLGKSIASKNSSSSASARCLVNGGDDMAAEKMLPDLLLWINAIASGLRTTGCSMF